MPKYEPTGHDYEAVQKIAEALFAVNTDHPGIASGRSACYIALETALREALWHVYGLTTPQCEQVRGLLTEYGPDDMLTGTGTRGIESYVEFALAHPRRRHY